MAKAVDFDFMWRSHQENRKTAEMVNPEGNRCAYVLGLTLKVTFKPRPDRNELSFREISQPPKGIRGQPFLAKFYVKAEQFADRLREEWGEPDLNMIGINALDVISGKQGVIFVQNAWSTGLTKALLGIRTVDHVDLWNGTTMGSYPNNHEYSRDAITRADKVYLWLVPKIRLKAN